MEAFAGIVEPTDIEKRFFEIKKCPEIGRSHCELDKLFSILIKTNSYARRTTQQNFIVP